jgi:chromate transporter
MIDTDRPGRRTDAHDEGRLAPKVSLPTIAREWTRIGAFGFGGPAALITLLHRLCVQERGWISEGEFQDGIAAANLIPGPAALQLGIYCAWRLRAAAGAVIAGVCFALPGVVAILGLSVLFLAERPSLWLRGAAAGAGAAVAAVAVSAALGLLPASWRRAGTRRGPRTRWILFTLLGGTAAATLGPYLVLVLLACGLAEMAARSRRRGAHDLKGFGALPLAAIVSGGVGGIGALAWVALKVGALSYGGGFVIVPLIQTDAVSRYHWMTSGQFLTAVALGQITPGPVIQTVAVVGYAAAGISGGILAAVIAFAPSFLFVLFGARHFDRLRKSSAIQSFLTGAGPAAVGAIAGAAVPLAVGIGQAWQVAVLAAAAVWMIGLRRSVVIGLLAAGLVGVIVAFVGLPVGS